MKKNIFLNRILTDDYVIQLLKRIHLLKMKAEIYPDMKDIFRAFEISNLDDVKVVIFGQDPYYLPDVADGLAFSTKQSKTPASLKNIFKELKNEYPDLIIETNDLTSWAKQGVLLANTSLTVMKNMPNSHAYLGWSYVIEEAIEYINENRHNVIFLLWGNQAKKFKSLINEEKHHVLMSAHPSPLSANNGFFGNNHFKIANQILADNFQKEIDWNLKKE